MAHGCVSIAVLALGIAACRPTAAAHGGRPDAPLSGPDDMASEAHRLNEASRARLADPTTRCYRVTPVAGAAGRLPVLELALDTTVAAGGPVRSPPYPSGPPHVLWIYLRFGAPDAPPIGVWTRSKFTQWTESPADSLLADANMGLGGALVRAGPADAHGRREAVVTDVGDGLPAAPNSGAARWEPSACRPAD